MENKVFAKGVQNLVHNLHGKQVFVDSLINAKSVPAQWTLGVQYILFLAKTLFNVSTSRALKYPLKN